MTPLKFVLISMYKLHNYFRQLREKSFFGKKKLVPLPRPSQFLIDQLTLFQSGVTDYAHHIRIFSIRTTHINRRSTVQWGITVYKRA